jgi:hypothetical protein
MADSFALEIPYEKYETNFILCLACCSCGMNDLSTPTCSKSLTKIFFALLPLHIDFSS